MPYKETKKEYCLKRLNEKQRNVALLLLQGYENKHIAEVMQITPQAVSNYIKSPLFQEYLRSLRTRVEDEVVTNERMVSDLVPKVLGLAHELVDDALDEKSDMSNKDKISIVKHWTKPFVDMPTGGGAILSDKEIAEYKKRQQELYFNKNNIDAVDVIIEDVVTEADITNEKPKEPASLMAGGE